MKEIFHYQKKNVDVNDSRHVIGTSDRNCGKGKSISFQFSRMKIQFSMLRIKAKAVYDEPLKFLLETYFGGASTNKLIFEASQVQERSGHSV